MRRLVPAAALAALACAAPASAQSGISWSGALIGFDGPGFRTVAQWDMDVRFEGSVAVRFEGPGESGTIVWTPGASGQLTIARGRTPRGRALWDAYFAPDGGQATVAHVTRANGVCTDRSTRIFDSAATERGRGGVRIALVAPSAATPGLQLTETLCGGPLGRDLTPLQGAVRVPAATLSRGRFDLDFRRSAAFAHGEFHGTVESTLVAHVGRRVPGEVTRPEPLGKRYHELDVRYRVERLEGTLGASFRGAGLCDELASCGEAGSWLLRPGAARGSAELHVLAPATRPFRDLRTAAGLTGAGDGRRLDASGSGSWSSPTATLTATTGRAGAAPDCSDSRPIDGGGLALTRAGRSLEVQLYSGLGSPRTSCPGPGLGAQPGAAVLASGRVDVRALGRRTVRIPLTRGVSVTTDGWAGTTKPALTLVLRRTSVAQRTPRF